MFTGKTVSRWLFLTTAWNESDWAPLDTSGSESVMRKSALTVAAKLTIIVCSLTIFASDSTAGYNFPLLGNVLISSTFAKFCGGSPAIVMILRSLSCKEGLAGVDDAIGGKAANRTSTYTTTETGVDNSVTVIVMESYFTWSPSPELGAWARFKALYRSYVVCFPEKTELSSEKEPFVSRL
eukprot:32977_6